MPQAVITRAPETLAPYATALAALGLEVVAMPVTRHEAIEAGLDRVLRERTYAAIAVASARAAKALVEAWNAPASTERKRMVVTTWYEVAWGEPPDPPPPELDAKQRAKLPRVFAVGPATGKVLEEAGIEHTVDPDADDGDKLADVLIEALGRSDRSPPMRGVRVLMPRAAGGRHELLDKLVYAGATIDVMSVYKTFHADPSDESIRAGQQALEEGGAPICCVFAPSQVSALAELVPLSAIAATFVAIGETTATALRAAGARRVVAAAQPTPEGIAKAVRSVYPPKP